MMIQGLTNGKEEISHWSPKEIALVLRGFTWKANRHFRCFMNMGFTSADQISSAQELSLNREILMSDTVKHFLAVSTTIAHPDPGQPDNFSPDLQGFMTLIYFHSLNVTADILLGYFSFIFKCNFSSSLNLTDLCYDELLGWAAVTAAPCVYLEGLIENDAYKARHAALQIWSTAICSCCH